MSQIVVIGSSNTDMVIQSEKLPAPGETIIGGTFFMNPGGKGANQAVSAARLGGIVTFVTKVGNDLFGNEARANFIKEGINTDYILIDKESPSGVALINVDASGENCIVVAPGSNSNLNNEDIAPDLFKRSASDIFLIQLEIPLSTVSNVVRRAALNGNRVILNPAPARPLNDDMLNNLYLITPNETEASMLTGIKITDESSAYASARRLEDKGIKNIIITLGSAGAFVSTGSFSGMIPGVKVRAVDTTAAGDIFNGALAVAIAEGRDITDAVIFANKAASISVTRQGAQASAPFRNEVEQNLFTRP
jgi:ribokinase